MESKVRLIGIIQCDFAKERCSGFSCMNTFTKRLDAFAKYPKDAEIMAVPFNCGGCPGRRIPRIVANLVKDEIIIHLASCMVTDNGHYPPCPHLDYIETILKRKGMKVRKGSYRSKTATARREAGLYEQFDWDGE